MPSVCCGEFITRTPGEIFRYPGTSLTRFWMLAVEEIYIYIYIGDYRNAHFIC